MPREHLRFAIWFYLVASAMIACGDGGAGASSKSAPASAGASRIPTPTSAPVRTAPPSTGSAAAAGPIAFISERYEYSVQLPAGWYVLGEQLGAWTPNDIGYIGPGTDAFEEDYEGRGTKLNFPGITYGLYISAAEVAPTMSLETWTDSLAVTMDDGSSCHGSPERETLTVAGEKAELLVYDRTDCLHDHHVLVLGVIHGGRGFDIFWLAKQGASDARRENFESVLETFKFLD